MTRSDRVGSVAQDAQRTDDVVARAPSPPPGGLRVLAYDEDYRYLADPARRTGVWERLKHVPLGSGASLTTGGEARLRYQYTRNEGFGEGRRGDGEFQERLRLWGDLRFGDAARGFVELQSAFTQGRRTTPGPADRDPAELHQAFLDLAGGAGGAAFAVRVGRQEIAFGQQRLVGIRDGANVRRAFDGVRLFAAAGDWEAGALAVRPVRDTFGSFNDAPDRSTGLWGGYVAHRLPSQTFGEARLGLLYLGYDREAARFDGPAVADERRRTLALRLAGRRGPLDYDLELIGQAGRWGRRSIRAWMVSANAGYTFPDAPWAPRLGLSLDAASGDDDPDDRRLGTFNPLFARAPTLNAEIAQPNVVALTPTLLVRPASDLTFDVGWSPLWRQSTNDGVYNRTNLPFRSGRAASGRFIGHRVVVGARWQVTDFVQISGYANRFWTGPLLEETGPAKDQLYLALYTTLRF